MSAYHKYYKMHSHRVYRAALFARAVYAVETSVRPSVTLLYCIVVTESVIKQLWPLVLLGSSFVTQKVMVKFQ